MSKIFVGHNKHNSVLPRSQGWVVMTSEVPRSLISLIAPVTRLSVHSVVTPPTFFSLTDLPMVHFSSIFPVVTITMFQFHYYHHMARNVLPNVLLSLFMSDRVVSAFVMGFHLISLQSMRISLRFIPLSLDAYSLLLPVSFAAVLKLSKSPAPTKNSK